MGCTNGNIAAVEGRYRRGPWGGMPLAKGAVPEDEMRFIFGILCLTTLACEGVPPPEKRPAAITAPLPELPEAPPAAADATPAEIKARQAQYLEAWRRAEKAGLSPAQLEEERATLKRKVLDR